MKFTDKITLHDSAARLLRIVVVAYVVLFALQRFLVFPTYIVHHYVKTLLAPAEYNLADYKEIHLTDADGTHVLGWYHAPAEGMPTILYFHGNGSSLNMRAERDAHFAAAGYGVFVLAFRGYPGSEGSPSEEGLYQDARAAFQWLKGQGLASKIIVYGESLGTGVAAEMAVELPVDGVVLQSAYTSIPDMAAKNYWFLPGVRYLVLDRFDTLSKIAQIHAPLLIIHGDHDTIVPFSQGQQLATAAKGQRSEFVTVAGAGHMNIPDEIILNSMNNFFHNNKE